VSAARNGIVSAAVRQELATVDGDDVADATGAAGATRSDCNLEIGSLPTRSPASTRNNAPTWTLIGARARAFVAFLTTVFAQRVASGKP
jgi:hypothetical protein